jgi:hypothetical protein
MHYVHIIFKEKNQAKNIGTGLIPILTVTTEIWAVVCECGGITWSALKSDLIYFRLPAPDGSAIASRGTYFQITDVDSFITCVQMAIRAPSCINYSWLVRMNLKNPFVSEKVCWYLEPNLNLAITTYDNLQTFPSWVRGSRFYILSWIQIRKKPGSEYYPQGLGLICVMGTRQKFT